MPSGPPRSSPWPEEGAGTAFAGARCSWDAWAASDRSDLPVGPPAPASWPVDMGSGSRGVARTLDDLRDPPSQLPDPAALPSSSAPSWPVLGAAFAGSWSLRRSSGLLDPGDLPVEPAAGTTALHPGRAPSDLPEPTRAIAEVAARARGVLWQAGASDASLGGTNRALGLSCGVDLLEAVAPARNHPYQRVLVELKQEGGRGKCVALEIHNCAQGDIEAMERAAMSCYGKA